MTLFKSLWRHGISATALATMFIAGGCDSRSPCERAEAAYNQAAEDCEEPTQDFCCDCIVDSTADCTDYFETIAESATCDSRGRFSYDSGGSCS